MITQQFISFSQKYSVSAENAKRFSVNGEVRVKSVANDRKQINFAV